MGNSVYCCYSNNNNDNTTIIANSKFELTKSKNNTNEREERNELLNNNIIFANKPQSIIFDSNMYLNISKDFLKYTCNIPEKYLDKEGDCLGGWRDNDKNGPPGYLKDYIPPKGWTAVGLKVKGLYDNGDNTWLGRQKERGEWYIGYHGTREIRSVKGIILYNFEPGIRNCYNEDKNENPLNNEKINKVGNGVYLAKDINVAKSYADIINYKRYKFRVVFMCRINPELVRICNDDRYYVVSGKDVYNEVRTYRVLFHYE
jgi:hypothetical protein